MLILAGALLALVPTPLSRAQTEQPRPKVAILVFDGIQLFDFMGPYDVLRRNNDVYLVAEKPLIETYGATGRPLKITPQYTFSDAPRPDVLVIPGGGSYKPGKSGVGTQLQNPNVIKWVRDTGKQAKYVLTVCNGAFIAAEAGLLDGMKATTFHTMIDELRKAYPKVEVVDNQRFVDNGKVIATAGITSGVDGALYLETKLHGKVAAQLNALSLEYAWDPESKYVRAALADMYVPEAIYEVLEPAADLTDFSGDRNSWTSTWNLKKPNFSEVADGVSKGLAQNASVKRPDSRQLKWKVTGRDNTHWLLSLEESSGQKVTVGFQRIE
jgi:putative intracellular protease/amidase